MATTTNYSWTTPDDTALVKDGAAAIRSLGTAIDTTVFNNASAAIAKTIVDAKGDLIAATAADTVSRLAVGTNDQVLVADSTTATGLKWATPASGGAMTSIATGTLSGASVTISSIPGTYKNLYLVVENPYSSGGDPLGVRLNGNTGTVYRGTYGEQGNTSWVAPAATTRLDFKNADTSSATQYATCILNIENYASSTGGKGITYLLGRVGSTTFGIQSYDSVTAITSLTILVNAGTFSGGTYTLYGVK